MRLHRARRRALRQQQGASVHTQGTCGASSAAGCYLHAFRRVQAVCGRIHRRAHLHQNRGRRHGQRLVLRHAGRRLFSGRQAHARGSERHSRPPRPLCRYGKGKGPRPHGTILLCAQRGNRGQRLRSFHQQVQAGGICSGGISFHAGTDDRAARTGNADFRRSGRTEGDAVIIKLSDAFKLQMGKTPSREISQYWGGPFHGFL